MTYNQARQELPEAAVWQCSFGYPGMDNYAEVYWTTDTRYRISRKDRYDDKGWQITEMGR